MGQGKESRKERGNEERKDRVMGKVGGVRKEEERAENYVGYFPLASSRPFSILLHLAL